MFAARFDPTKISSVEVTEHSDVNEKPDTLLPQKRSRETVANPIEPEDDSEADDSAAEEGPESDKTEEKEFDEDSSDSDNELPGKSEEEDNASNDETDKHTSVLNRFKQTLSLQDQLGSANTEEEPDKDVEMKDVHSLTPIPQPAKVRDSSLRSLDASSYKAAAWDSATKIHYNNAQVKHFDAYKDKLDSRLLRNIINNFSDTTFPIQSALLDNLLPTLLFAQSANKKRFTRQVGDVLVNASTGSGKTLAYSIPLIQSLRSRTVSRVRAIILVPTKILIHQVYECLSKLSQGTSLNISMSKLENSLKEEHSKFLQNSPDILIVTPGRLVDHLQLESFNLKSLKFLVLDEADRLLNQSFQNWNQVLFAQLSKDKEDKKPGNVIKMVFSATLTTNAEKLYNLHLHNPKIYLMDNVKLYSLPKKLQELNIQIPTAKSGIKPLVLLRLLDEIRSSSRPEKILIFVKSNEASIRLASLLQTMLAMNLAESSKMIISSINSNNSKGSNRKLIQDFASVTDAKSVLISTDLMSRGIDINEVTHVINYDLPISSQQYVHRCGRTARANTEGIAMNLLIGKGEHKFWSDHIDVDLSRDIDGYQPKPYKETEELSDLYHTDEKVDKLYKECLQQLHDRNLEQ